MFKEFLSKVEPKTSKVAEDTGGEERFVEKNVHVGVGVDTDGLEIW